MKKTYQITTVVTFLAILAIAYAFLVAQYSSAHDASVEKVKDETATFIHERVDALLTESDFGLTDSARLQSAFSRFFAKIQSPEIVRIKVWNNDYVVIWSDLSETIGQRFPDNESVAEALAGEVEMEIEAEKSEHVGERQFQNLAELYVPIYGKSGSVIGVMEVYTPAKLVNDETSRSFRLTLILTLICAFVALCGTFFLARRLAAR